jgi:hypothetical protein
MGREVVVVNESVQGASRTDITVTLTLTGVTEDVWTAPGIANEDFSVSL